MYCFMGTKKIVILTSKQEPVENPKKIAEGNQKENVVKARAEDTGGQVGTKLARLTPPVTGNV